MYALPSLEFCIWGRRFQTEQSYDCLCWLAFSLGVASLVLSRHDHLFLDQAVSSKWIYLAFPAWSICVLSLYPRTLLLYPPSDLIIPSCYCKLTLSSAFLQLGMWRGVHQQAPRTPPSLIPFIPLILHIHIAFAYPSLLAHVYSHARTPTKSLVFIYRKDYHLHINPFQQHNIPHLSYMAPYINKYRITIPYHNAILLPYLTIYPLSTLPYHISRSEFLSYHGPRYEHP